MYGHALVNGFSGSYARDRVGDRNRSRFEVGTQVRGCPLLAPGGFAILRRPSQEGVRAMAKTESTAVNELIDLVQSGKPLAEPAADLFSAPAPISVGGPRVTPPIAHGAGEVAPLPPRRSPRATSQHAMLPQPIRMTTADPERGNTIPP